MEEPLLVFRHSQSKPGFGGEVWKYRHLLVHYGFSLWNNVVFERDDISSLKHLEKDFRPEAFQAGIWK